MIGAPFSHRRTFTTFPMEHFQVIKISNMTMSPRPVPLKKTVNLKAFYEQFSSYLGMCQGVPEFVTLAKWFQACARLSHFLPPHTSSVNPPAWYNLPDFPCHFGLPSPATTCVHHPAQNANPMFHFHFLDLPTFHLESLMTLVIHTNDEKQFIFMQQDSASKPRSECNEHQCDFRVNIWRSSSSVAFQCRLTINSVNLHTKNIQIYVPEVKLVIVLL